MPIDYEPIAGYYINVGVNGPFSITQIRYLGEMDEEQNEGIFPTEVKDTKVESPKLPPLHPESESSPKKQTHHKKDKKNEEGLLENAAGAMIDGLLGEEADSHHSSQKNSTKTTPQISNHNSKHGTGTNSSLHSSGESPTSSAPGTPKLASSSSKPSTQKSSQRSQSVNLINRKPPRRLTYSQQMKQIPTNILYNPYVTKRLNIFPITETTIPRAAQPKEKYHDKPEPVMDELTQKLYDGEEVKDEEITMDQLTESAKILRDMEKDLVEKSRYPEAKKAANAYDKAQADIKRRKNYNDAKTGIEELLAKRNELLALIENDSQEWKENLRLHDQMTQDRIQQMKDQFDEDIDTFNRSIPEGLGPYFKRNSVTYLQMRSNEKYLAFNRKFDEAENIKQKADVLEEEEKEENLRKMDKYYRDKKKRMIKQQKLSMENFISAQENRRREIIFQKNKDIQGKKDRVDLINKQIKLECEKKGIRQRNLNLDIVDEKRVEMLKNKEKDLPIPKSRVGQRASQQSSRKNNDQLQEINEENGENLTNTPVNEVEDHDINDINDPDHDINDINDPCDIE